VGRKEGKVCFMEIKVNEITEGDCLEVLRDVPNDFVDIICTSPPYGGISHKKFNKKTGKVEHYDPYKDDYPEEEYQMNQRDVLRECFRVLKDDGIMFYNHKNKIKDGISITPYKWLKDSYFFVKQELIYVCGTALTDPIRFYPTTERIYVLAKNRKTVLNNVEKRTDILKPKRKDKYESHFHPRSFPEGLVSMLLRAVANTNSQTIVLDPYSGGGTTAMVAKKLGMKYIGIELDKEYAEKSRERLSMYLF